MPFNNLDIGEKSICLGKRKNRGKNSALDESEQHFQNEGSKKGKSSLANSFIIN